MFKDFIFRLPAKRKIYYEVITFLNRYQIIPFLAEIDQQTLIPPHLSCLQHQKS